MKTRLFLMSIAVAVAPRLLLTAQPTETNAPPAWFNTLSPDMLAREQYFEKNFFSKGIGPESLGEGSGYLPYLRERRLYDLRRDYLGRTGAENRWAVFRDLRRRSLDRNGAQPAADWQSVGPNKMEGQGGRMISHAIDPSDPQLVWAGSATGGLWKSTDGGEHWTPVTDHIPSTGVGAVAVNPLNSQSLLIGTGEGYALNSVSIRPGLGVFKSTSQGATWAETNFSYASASGVSVFRIVWHPTDTQIVWLAATNGLWKSSDAGQNWVLKKGDGTNHQTSVCNDVLLYPGNPSRMLAAIEGKGIYKSDDGGENWLLIGDGLPADNLDYINLDQCRDFPDVVYASIAAGQAGNFGLRGLYRSDDGGDSWAKLTNAPDAFCPPGYISCQGWYDNAVAVAPDNPQHVWLGGVTLWRSLDGGQNWTQRDRYACQGCTEPPPCLTYVDQHDIGFDPFDSQTLYVFNDGGVSKSVDGGECWAPKNEGLVNAQFYAIASGRSNPGILIGAMQDHGLQGISLAENTGGEWDRWGFLDGADVEVHPTNPNILYGTWVDGTYWKSVNGVHGLASQISSGINLAENGGFHFAQVQVKPGNGNLLLGHTRTRIYRSVNGGFVWTAVASAPNVARMAFSEFDPEYCYAAAYHPNAAQWSFWRSENSGASWSQTASAPGWRVTDLKTSALEAGVLYATRNSNLPGNPHVYKSVDHGDTWTPIQGDLPDISVNGIAVHAFAPGWLYVATDLGVFVSTDDGGSWTEFNDQLPVSIVLDIQFNPADTTLLIGTHGRGAWRTRAPALSATGVSASPEQTAQPRIYPNPFSQSTRIGFVVRAPQSCTVEVVDGLGQPIRTLFQGVLPAGEHTFDWDGRQAAGQKAPPGIYFVLIRAGARKTVGKVILNAH